MTELAGVLVGNYFLLECLAREGMVETYRARPTTRGGYDVILRLFRPEFPDPTSFREHFATEVEKVWRCHHEHIQPLLEFGTGDDLLYCAALMPEAETLEQYLQRQPEDFLSLPLVLRIVTQLCEALQYAHDLDIVHGNIQPSSILIHDQHVLLTHFAMKRAYQDGEPLVAQIDEGNAAYIAPEQALGMIRPASDIYALGVLLYRLLCGTVPYDGESPGEIALKHTDEPIPSLRALRPEIPEELELLVRVALAKSPEARFPSPAALAQALHATAVPDIPQVQVVPATPERRIVVQARRTRFTWSRAASFLTLSVLLLGLMGASFFVFSLPKFMHGVRGQPFWNSGQLTVSSPTPGSSSTANSSTPTTLAGTPTAGSGTPIGAPNFPTKATPTAVSFTPTRGGTVVLTPTPPPSSFLCVSGTLSIDGSQNLEPLLEQISQDYQVQCPDMSISLGADGSRIALNAVEGNQIDAAASDLTARPSRNLTDQPIAALLYAVIVNPDVEINGLSSAVLRDIYQGRITNWSQVGGPDEPITIVQHPTTDTVAAIFRTFVLNGASEHIKGPRLRMTSGWAQAVAQISGAISYVPLMAVQGLHVSVLAIDGIAPSLQSLVQGSYAFWSVQHLYTQDDGTSQFRAYLSFIHSTQETSVFSQYAAIPASMVPQGVLASHLPGPEI